MITGAVSADREAVIPLTVRGHDGQERELEAVMDTGFNGYLTLPPSLIEELGCPFISRGSVILGNGRMEDMDIFAATVIWEGQARTVETDAADTDVLVGMSLIYGYNLRVRALDGGIVTIEKVS